MKAFLFSCVLIVLVLSVSVLNSLYIDRTTDELLTLVSDPDAFGEKWNRYEKIYLFSVHTAQRSCVETALAEVKAAKKAGSEPDLLLASARLAEGIRSIRGTELFSLRSVI